jgi:DNA sulfur modification protein DndC
MIRSAIKRILKLYHADARPWFLAFSGGKDSTALVAAAYAALLQQSKLHKTITLLYCDTGVEIPVVASYVKKTLRRLSCQAKSDGLPLKARILRPPVSERYFARVIGHGYPPPTNIFRWCTDRLRVGPVQRAMESASASNPILLLGTRWDESQQRNRTLNRLQLEDKFLFRQTGHKNTTVFAPLALFSAQDIWSFLHSNLVPRCLDIGKLIELYQSANGGQCSGLCPSCPICTSGRFGCWTCTVVRKDKALTNMVRDGHASLKPLLDFRNWLAIYRDRPDCRRKYRRNGNLGPGPLTVAARKTILARLMQTQRVTGWSLLPDAEEMYIRQCWAGDRD